MKNTIIALLGVAVIIGAGLLGLKHKNNKTEEIRIDPPTETPDPSNSTFSFENSEFEAPLAVTLKDGKNVSPLAPDSEIMQEIILDSMMGYGDVNNDSKKDVGVILTQSGGGTGVFSYIAGYISGPVRYKGTNAIFLGDRIIPKSITLTNNTITVTYLDRAENEAMAAEPTISITKTFTLSDGILVER